MSVGVKTNLIMNEYLDPKMLNCKVVLKVLDFQDLVLPMIWGFLILILNPMKAKRVTKKIATMVIQVWKGEYKVDWVAYMHKVIQKMVKDLDPTKISWMSTYLSHTYKSQECLTK